MDELIHPKMGSIAIGATRWLVGFVHPGFPAGLLLRRLLGLRLLWDCPQEDVLVSFFPFGFM